MALINLPEPNAFTIPEIAERWKCDEERIISYLESDMLTMQVDLTGVTASREIETAYVDVFDIEDLSLNGFYSIPKEAVIAAWRLGEGGECSPVFRLVIDEDGNEYKLRNSIDSSSLRITKVERKRFEAEHNIVIDEQMSQSPLAPKVIESEYWRKLECAAKSAIEKYPEWEKGVARRKIQKTGNLLDWVKSSGKVNAREAELIVKVLTDIFRID
ncbi:MAG: hypothetical protein V7682_09680 [Cycloclasticus sp.]